MNLYRVGFDGYYPQDKWLTAKFFRAASVQHCAEIVRLWLGNDADVRFTVKLERE